MLPFGHLGIPLVAAEAVERLAPRLRGRLDYRLVALGSFLPDLVDKPLGMVILADTLRNGRIIAHSLLFPLLLFLAGWGWKRLRPPLFLLSLSTLGHLLSDQMWRDPRTFLFPLLGGSFPGVFFKGDYFALLVRGLLTQPDVYIPEIIGFLVLLRLAVRVWRSGTIGRLVLRGRLEEPT